MYLQECGKSISLTLLAEASHMAKPDGSSWGILISTFCWRNGKYLETITGSGTIYLDIAYDGHRWVPSEGPSLRRFKNPSSLIPGWLLLKRLLMLADRILTTFKQFFSFVSR